MKMTLVALSLATAAVGTAGANAHKTIEKAINKADAGVIRGFVKAGFTLSPQEKETYVALASQKVADRKAQLGSSFCFSHLSSFDKAHLTIGTAGAVLLFIKNYQDWSHFKDHVPGDKASKTERENQIAAAAASLYAIDILLGYYTKTQKKDKKYENLEKAEKVLRAVNDFPVTNEAPTLEAE